jgi:hypothetical protein
MVFQLIVSTLLCALIIYALLQKKDFPLVGRAMPLVALLGIYMVWFPERTSEAATWVGIGRGVDLMMYIWILASGLILLVLHLKLVTYERKLTELARQMAIAAALAPDPEQPPVPTREARS